MTPVRRPSGARVVTPAALTAMQRAVGNAAVSRMLEQEQEQHAAADVQRSAVHEVLRSPGTPMADGIRAEMETRLGADFSDVRLHTGATARESAAGIGARAYTSGSHIVLGSGGGDKHTLAHELTHVIQQRSGPVAGTDNGSGLRVSDPSDRFEREAEANASRVLSRPLARESAAEHAAHAHGTQAGEPSVQRRPTAKPAGEEGEHTHVDADYPGLRLILDQKLTDEHYEKIYQLAGTEDRVIFDEDGSYGYIKADDDLETYYKLVNMEIGPEQAQADLSGHVNRQRDSSYHVRAGAGTFEGAQIDQLQDFAAQGVRPGQLVEVSVALLQQASGRAQTVAGGLDEKRLSAAVTGMKNSAALEPIKIQVSAGGISIQDGNHRLGAAVQLGSAYAPCKIV
ncbi:DUF4157 domain-containing protein [Kitasatospora sp. NBC_01300]|uniref:eCIS core domain-containing protein n=1 Tax=Kitasatospora sp. NBC_01300 TaxID=2903574 RepID=UPI00352BF80E|nr:DUF4157 domain-containing protein [Kitasatospora sp. NBC_01300]